MDSGFFLIWALPASELFGPPAAPAPRLATHTATARLLAIRRRIQSPRISKVVLPTRESGICQMLMGCHTAVNPQTQLNLLLLSNYKLYKPLFALGISAMQARSKGLI